MTPAPVLAVSSTTTSVPFASNGMTAHNSCRWCSAAGCGLLQSRSCESRYRKSMSRPPSRTSCARQATLSEQVTLTFGLTRLRRRAQAVLVDVDRQHAPIPEIDEPVEQQGASDRRRTNCPRYARSRFPRPCSGSCSSPRGSRRRAGMSRRAHRASAYSASNTGRKDLAATARSSFRLPNAA